jgi:hypothetical protein
LAADRKAAAPSEPRAVVAPATIVIGVVVILGLAGFAYLDFKSKQPQPPPPPLTGAARAYLKNLAFVGADGQTPQSPEMDAHESYMKQSVVSITGNIKNNGDRVLSVVEINCVFYDIYGQVVLRERVPIVSKKMGKLAPGDAKPFRLAFDTIPDSWNQQMPQMVIAGIEFAG